MEATVSEIGQKKIEPLDEHTAVELWREIRRYCRNVYLVQEVTVGREVELTGIESGGLHLRISIAGPLKSGQVKMIQAAASGAGREVVLDGGLRIY
jgi:hypothetical protein